MNALVIHRSEVRATFIGYAEGPSEVVPAPAPVVVSCLRESRCSTRVHFERLNELFCEGIETQETMLAINFLDHCVKDAVCPACGRDTIP